MVAIRVHGRARQAHSGVADQADRDREGVCGGPKFLVQLGDIEDRWGLAAYLLDESHPFIRSVLAVDVRDHDARTSPFQAAPGPVGSWWRTRSTPRGNEASATRSDCRQDRRQPKGSAPPLERRPSASNRFTIRDSSFSLSVTPGRLAAAAATRSLGPVRSPWELQSAKARNDVVTNRLIEDRHECGREGDPEQAGNDLDDRIGSAGEHLTAWLPRKPRRHAKRVVRCDSTRVKVERGARK